MSRTSSSLASFGPASISVYISRGARGSGARRSSTATSAPACGVTYAVETLTIFTRSPHLRANAIMLSTDVMFACAACDTGRSNSTDAAQWMMCVMRWASAVRRGRAFGSPRSASTTWQMLCQPSGSIEKTFERDILSKRTRASVLRLRRMTRWISSMPSSSRRRMSSSRTTLPTKPVEPVRRTRLLAVLDSMSKLTVRPPS